MISAKCYKHLVHEISSNLSPKFLKLILIKGCIFIILTALSSVLAVSLLHAGLTAP